MSYPNQDGFSKDSGAGEAEQTLRLIATLPAPQGLEDRVNAGLRSAPRRARVFAWPRPFSPAGGWLRGAAAAAIVFVVAGGGWGIYSRVQPGQPTQGSAVPRVGAPGGFSEGGAVRRPQTLVGPVVTAPAPAATPKPKAPSKPARTPVPNAKSTAASKTPAQSAQPAVR
jgi:hypothetical protein